MIRRIAPRAAGRSLVTAITMFVLVVPATAALAQSGVAAAPSGATAYVSPTGAGTTCTATQPCSDVSTALTVAGAGGQVLLESGRYPKLNLPPSATLASYPSNVKVAPAPGATPLLNGVRTAVAHVTWTHLDIAGTFYSTWDATSSALVDSHVHGLTASVLVRGSHVTIRHNLIEGGHAHDGINVAGHPGVNTGIRIIGNTVRDFTEGTPQQEHADCIQLFDTSNVLIDRNNLYDCYASGLRFSPGARLGISNVRVVSNFVQGCLPTRQHCPSSVAADLRYAATGVTLTHNTFGHGIVFLPTTGIAATHDIVGYLSTSSCRSILQQSVIVYYLPWTCSSRVPGQRNTTQAVTYVAPDRGNLHLRSAITGTTALRTTSSTAALLDIDRQPFTTTVPGADQS